MRIGIKKNNQGHLKDVGYSKVLKMSNEEISCCIIGVIVKPTRMMKFGMVSPEDPPSFEEVQYTSQVVNGLLQNPPHLTQSQLVELMPMAEAPLVHLESAFLLQCMPLQEGLQQEEVCRGGQDSPPPDRSGD